MGQRNKRIQLRGLIILKKKTHNLSPKCQVILFLLYSLILLSHIKSVIAGAHLNVPTKVSEPEEVQPKSADVLIQEEQYTKTSFFNIQIIMIDVSWKSFLRQINLKTLSYSGQSKIFLFFVTGTVQLSFL